MQKKPVVSVLDDFFDTTTMSVHLKEGVAVTCKKGKPGAITMERDDRVMSKDELYALADQVMAEIDERDDGFLEIDRKLFKIIQLGSYRTVLVYPPLADGIEMTIVRPVKKMTLDYYGLEDRVLHLLEHDAKGVLISGAPGSGKTTFAQAVLERHLALGKITKTIESPRDLIVPDEVVQYSFSYGSHNDLRDILLLSRPDFCVYDEVRNVDDFLLFKDLRLTGIGLLGVIHATRPVDGIQRFLGHIELGIIPQMMDTVVFIDKGQLTSIYQLSLVVKVPEGMESGDLARPVILVTDFFTEKVSYEIYSFGEQIVVMPLAAVEANARGRAGLYAHAKQALQQSLEQLFDFDFLVSVKDAHRITLYVPERHKGTVIGSKGSKINALERDLGVRISVSSFMDLPYGAGPVDSKLTSGGSRLVLTFTQEFVSREVCLLVEDELLYETVDNRGRVSLTGKGLVRKMQKRGYVMVDLAAL